jgi:hypothetical protein
MSYLGHIVNGVVVFDKPVPLPEGSEVRVEATTSDGHEFWQPLTIDQLAERQSVPALSSLDDYLGGWPEDELDDGFEIALVNWREQEREQLR